MPLLKPQPIRQKRPHKPEEVFAGGAKKQGKMKRKENEDMECRRMGRMRRERETVKGGLPANPRFNPNVPARVAREFE